MTMAEINTGTVNANGINFHYLEMGAGAAGVMLPRIPRPRLVISPPVARPGGRRFPRGGAVHAGGMHPLSRRADGRYQQVALCRDVLALIGALGAERAYLIGNDWGGGSGYRRYGPGTGEGNEAGDNSLRPGGSRPANELPVPEGHMAFIFLPVAPGGTGAGL